MPAASACDSAAWVFIRRKGGGGFDAMRGGFYTGEPGEMGRILLTNRRLPIALLDVNPSRLSGDFSCLIHKQDA